MAQMDEISQTDEIPDSRPRFQPPASIGRGRFGGHTTNDKREERTVKGRFFVGSNHFKPNLFLPATLLFVVG